MTQKDKKQIWIVCTGNTCRSPMAQAVLQQMLQQAGKQGDYNVCSGGLAVAEGSLATQHAAQVCHEKGLDLTAHRAHRVTLAELQAAERVFVMTGDHRDAIASADPALFPKMEVMGIPDPYGKSLAVYRDCIAQMQMYFKDVTL